MPHILSEHDVATIKLMTVDTPLASSTGGHGKQLIMRSTPGQRLSYVVIADGKPRYCGEDYQGACEAYNRW